MKFNKKNIGIYNAQLAQLNYMRKKQKKLEILIKGEWRSQLSTSPKLNLKEE